MTRIARVDGRAYVGDEDGFVPADATAAATRAVRDLLAPAARGELTGPEGATAARIPATDLSFDSPLASTEYGKLWGIGLNYADHAADLDETQPAEPASFMQPSTAVTGPGGPIRLPPTRMTERVTAEAELGVVVGRTCTDVGVGDVNDVAAGYVPVIDVTADDILERNPRFLTRAKSFDTFLVIGPWIATTDSVDDLASVTVRTVVDGEVCAENSVGNMLHSPRELVAFHADRMTLEPGDVIATGTPGAHVVSPGNTITAEITSFGDLSADVVR